jgi:hypothetical protein
VLSESRSVVVAAGYQNRFLLKETSTAGVSVGIPTKYVDVGAAMNYFGYSQYNEIQGGVTLSRKFSKYFSLGVGASYYSAWLSPEEGAKGTAIVQVGLLSEIFPKFFIGFNAYNVAQTNISLNATQKRIPAVFELGLSYTFGENLLFIAQIDKEIDHPVRWHTGFEYRIIKELSVSLGGYGSNSFTPTFGASLYLKGFTLDMNFEYHTVLGLVSICGLSYQF